MLLGLIQVANIFKLCHRALSLAHWRAYLQSGAARAEAHLARAPGRLADGPCEALRCAGLLGLLCMQSFCFNLRDSFRVKLSFLLINLLVCFAQVLNVLIEGLIHKVLRCTWVKLAHGDRRDGTLMPNFATFVSRCWPHEEIILGSTSLVFTGNQQVGSGAIALLRRDVTVWYHTIASATAHDAKPTGRVEHQTVGRARHVIRLLIEHLQLLMLLIDQWSSSLHIYIVEIIRHTFHLR